MEARPARVRATRREVADMWVMVKTSTKIVGCFYLRSDGLLLLSAAMIAIGGLTVRRNSVDRANQKCRYELHAPNLKWL
jgi:hypothetical protein